MPRKKSITKSNSNWLKTFQNEAEADELTILDFQLGAGNSCLVPLRHILSLFVCKLESKEKFSLNFGKAITDNSVFMALTMAS